MGGLTPGATRVTASLIGTPAGKAPMTDENATSTGEGTATATARWGVSGAVSAVTFEMSQHPAEGERIEGPAGADALGGQQHARLTTSSHRQRKNSPPREVPATKRTGRINAAASRLALGPFTRIKFPIYRTRHHPGRSRRQFWATACPLQSRLSITHRC
jgi:hypothetical protein